MCELPSVVCKVNKYSRLIKRPCLISGRVPAFVTPVRKTAPISGRVPAFVSPVRKTAPISGLVPAVWGGLGMFRKYFLENVDVYSQHPSYLLVRGIIFKVQMLCRGELLVRT